MMHTCPFAVSIAGSHVLWNHLPHTSHASQLSFNFLGFRHSRASHAFVLVDLSELAIKTCKAKLRTASTCSCFTLSSRTPFVKAKAFCTIKIMHETINSNVRCQLPSSIVHCNNLSFVYSVPPHYGVQFFYTKLFRISWEKGVGPPNKFWIFSFWPPKNSKILVKQTTSTKCNKNVTLGTSHSTKVEIPGKRVRQGCNWGKKEKSRI